MNHIKILEHIICLFIRFFKDEKLITWTKSSLKKIGAILTRDPNLSEKYFWFLINYKWIIAFNATRNYFDKIYKIKLFVLRNHWANGRCFSFHLMWIYSKPLYWIPHSNKTKPVCRWLIEHFFVDSISFFFCEKNQFLPTL